MKRILKAYLLTVLACASVLATVCGVFTADANAKKISLGQTEAAAAVFKNGNETVLDCGGTNIALGRDDFFWLEQAAKIMPAPVNNAYWFFSGICLLWANGLES